MFARLLKDGGSREILVNLNHVSVIEILYGVPDESGGGLHWKTTPRDAREEPAATKTYKFKVGDETCQVAADPDDPLGAVLDQLYRDALKT